MLLTKPIETMKRKEFLLAKAGVLQNILGLILLFLLVAGTIQLQLPNKQKANWTKMHQSKEFELQEFNEAKFGLFIHWGLYSGLAGEWLDRKYLA